MLHQASECVAESPEVVVECSCIRWTPRIARTASPAVWRHRFSPAGNARSSFAYGAPQIGLNTQYVGLDVGYLVDLSSHPVPPADQFYYYREEARRGTWIGGIRLGRLDRTYSYVDCGMSVPLSVGSGVVQAGLGFGSTTGGPTFCLGLGAIADDNLMIDGKGDIPIEISFLSRQMKTRYLELVCERQRRLAL